MAGDRRPAGIGLIAWSWILTGAVMILGALPFPGLGGGGEMGLPPSTRMMLGPHMIQWVQDFMHGVLSRLPPWVGFLNGGSAVVTLCLGTAAVVAGAALLKLRPWGRYGCMALSWIGIAYGLVLGAAWHALSIALRAELQARQLDANLNALGTEMLVMGVVLVIAIVAPLIWMVLYLHSSRIRRLTDRKRALTG